MSIGLPKARQATGLALLALSVLVVPSCSSLEIWGRKAEEVRRLLASGDHSFLRDVDFDKNRVQEALDLGEGAPYCLALAFRSLGLEPQATQLLRLQIAQDDGVWSSLALPPLLDALLDQEDYDTAARLAADHLADPSELIDRDLVRKAIVEARYWQKDDRATLAALAAYFPSGRSSARPEIDAELALFRAVASSRAGTDGWPELFLRLCLEQPASTIHVRAEQFLERTEAVRSALPAITAALIDAKAAVASGQPGRALGGLEAGIGALSGRAPALLIRESAAAYLAAGEAGRGARFFSTAARGLAGDARLAALEAAGRLYRAMGAGGDAAAAYAAVADTTADPGQHDRALWYLADIAGRGPTRAALAELLRGLPAWHDPAYFDDLIDALATRLLADGDVAGLKTLFTAVSGLEVPSRIRIYYILHRLGVRDLEPSDAMLAAGTTTVMEDYYRLLLDAGPPAADSPPPDKEGALDFVVSRMLDFGLYDEATDLADKGDGKVSRAARLEASRRLIGTSRYRDAISLAGSGYPWDEPGREAALVAYPRPYEREIRDLARREKMDEGLLFAIAREESAFDPQILSAAGAVGLTQLLPSTAEEEARRMRMRAYDLRAASDNLSIGFHYLGRLVKLQESLPLGLAAYNAGLTRIREWKRQYANLPLDLVFEAIPFEETRHYLRKVFVSTAIYDVLYEKGSPRRTTEMFFPEAAAPR